jgi:hypothetical protein
MHPSSVVLKDHEVVWDVTPAGLGGRLYVTDRRLLYETSTGSGSGEVLLSDVTEVRPWNWLGLLPFGLAIVTRDGRRHTLRVRHRKPLIALINALCPADESSIPVE